MWKRKSTVYKWKKVCEWQKVSENEKSAVYQCKKVCEF